MVIQTWVFNRHFLEKEQSEPVTLRKTDNIWCFQAEFELRIFRTLYL